MTVYQSHNGGLSVILLENEHLSVYIDERLGAEITQIQVNGTELLACYDWESPVAVSKSSTYGKQRHDWLSEYRGGWQFLMPNAGPECEVDGVNIPFHGEWSRTRVDIIAQTESMVRVRAGTRLPVVVEREISLLSNPYRVVITTEVRNTSTEPTSFIWGEHPAFSLNKVTKLTYRMAMSLTLRVRRLVRGHSVLVRNGLTLLMINCHTRECISSRTLNRAGRR